MKVVLFVIAVSITMLSCIKGPHFPPSPGSNDTKNFFDFRGDIVPARILDDGQRELYVTLSCTNVHSRVDSIAFFELSDDLTTVDHLITFAVKDKQVKHTVLTYNFPRSTAYSFFASGVTKRGDTLQKKEFQYVVW